MSIDPQDDDALAAEYALGLLEGTDKAKARTRATQEAAFAARVTAWEARLTALTDPLEDVTPTPAAKAALLADLFPDAAPLPIWRRLWLWQGLTLASAAVAGLLWFAVPQGTEPLAGPLYTAQIVSEAGDFRVVAVVDKARNEVILTRTAGAAPEGRILQVWGHGEGEPTVSVGLWPDGETVRLPMPAEIAAVEGILTLGVSEEPPGGSPTGLPSGRVFGTVDIPGVVSAL